MYAFHGQSKHWNTLLRFCASATIVIACAPGCKKGSQTGSTATASSNGSSQAQPATRTVLKIGMVVTEQDPMFKGAVKLKELVETRTQGALAIEVYPSSQLGDTKDVQVMAKMGSNIAALTDASRLAEVLPEMGIIGAPYVVDTYEQAVQLVTSQLWKGWEEQLAQKDKLRILSFNWYQGARHLWTKKPIRTPADLKGIRMRTPGSPIWQETIKAMGASPTAMAWAEVYPALQQGAVDAVEAQHPAACGGRFYEVAKYVTKTSHFQLMTGLAVSDAWFMRLPEAHRKILKEAAFEAGKFASELTLSGLSANEKLMKEQGVTIAEVDIGPFKAATNDVYEKVGLSKVRQQLRAQLAQ